MTYNNYDDNKDGRLLLCDQRGERKLVLLTCYIKFANNKLKKF